MAIQQKKLTTKQKLWCKLNALTCTYNALVPSYERKAMPKTGINTNIINLTIMVFRRERDIEQALK